MVWDFLKRQEDDFLESLIYTIMSLEQQAIFKLLNEGVQFSQLLLYRRLEPTQEFGVLVDGKIACAITVSWSNTPLSVLYTSAPPMNVLVEMKFHEPYLHLNR